MLDIQTNKELVDGRLEELATCLGVGWLIVNCITDESACSWSTQKGSAYPRERDTSSTTTKELHRIRQIRSPMQYR
jgi:hypothetical protein